MPSSTAKQRSYAAMERTSLNLKRSKQSSESLTWENIAHPGDPSAGITIP